MRIGIFLGHPAHFHLFRNTISFLMDKGHKVYLIIKKKDILEDLVKREGYNYVVIREGRSNTKAGLIKSVLKMEIEMVKVLRSYKIELLSGSTLSFASRVICRIPVIVTGEDDSNVVPRYAGMRYLWRIISNILIKKARSA